MSGVTSRLQQLLDLFDRPTAVGFVRDQVGALAEFDRENGTRLLAELDATLDEFSLAPEAGTARLRSAPAQRALELVEADVGDPDERLALHLALKLHALLGEGASGDQHGVV